MPTGPNGGRAQKALAALLGEPTLARAARTAGVSERTLRYWLRKPAFLRAYRQARRQVLEAAVGQLQRAAGRAVRTLVKALATEKASDRIRAALGILDRGLRGAELLDMEERLAELERRQAAKEKAQ
jgi:DNA-binding transcriptional MerR regulator